MTTPTRRFRLLPALIVALLAATGCTADRPADHPAAARTPGDPAVTNPTVRPEVTPPTSEPTPSASATPTTRPADQPGTPERPNIIFITTDDQRADDMRWMPHTRRVLGGHGVTFTNGLSPHPLCCPARAEFATGQYGQNNGVHHNKGEHGGYQALQQPSNTLAAWLDESGYQTAMVGKYLNGYRPDAASRVGWDHWNPSVRGVYSYNHTTFFNDGEKALHTEHVDDVVTSYTQAYIEEFAAKDRPFFVWASNLSPHGASVPGGGQVKWVPPLAAARHEGMFTGTRSLSLGKPSFDTPVVDGPYARLSDRQTKKVDYHHAERIESLQAVDEGVRDIVRTLRATGELDNTYIVFTSDNGYLLGEHGLMAKNHIFSEALNVPFLVRVPSQRTPVVSPVPVTAVDIVPTIADLGRVKPGRKVDGVSFAPLLAGKDQPWRDTQLIQTGTEDSATDGWQIRGVRTHRWTYGLSMVDGSEQLYDRQGDPFELINRAEDPAYAEVVAQLRIRLEALVDCAGADCDRSFGPVPQPRDMEAQRSSR